MRVRHDATAYDVRAENGEKMGKIHGRVNSAPIEQYFKALPRELQPKSGQICLVSQKSYCEVQHQIPVI